MEKNRVKWASRRGMLELDLLLGNFVENAYDDLSLDVKEQYWALLECEDQDLFNWLIHRYPTENESLQSIVNTIRDCMHHSLKS